MSGCVIEPAGSGLEDLASIYRKVGFRPDLIDDLRFLVRRLGGTVFRAMIDGDVAGVSSCVPFATTGWVGGVAVRPQYRRRGLGERLTAEAVAKLQSSGVATILLHATSMAASMYGRMGFSREGEFAELSGPTLTEHLSSPAGIHPGREADLGAVLALDREVTGEDRSVLLRALWPAEGWVLTHGSSRGYHLRQTSTAAGAVVATDLAAGEALLRAALSRPTPGGPLRVPLPVDQEHTRELLETLGYHERLRTTRMRLGPPVALEPTCLFSAFNLYWG